MGLTVSARSREEEETQCSASLVVKPFVTQFPWDINRSGRRKRVLWSNMFRKCQLNRIKLIILKMKNSHIFNILKCSKKEK